MPRRHLLFLVMTLTAGLLAGAALPPPPLPKLKPDKDNWALPTAGELQRHVQQDMATVTSDLRWKGDAGSNASESSNWRFAGVVNKNGPAALIMATSQPDKLLRVTAGGTLPDGSLLQSVERDRITTKLDACVKTYQLLQTEPVETSGECEAPEAPVQGSDK